MTGRECPAGTRSTDRAATDEIGVGPVRPNDDQTNQKGPTTMKLTTTTFVSVDAVMQGIGGPDQDHSDRFEDSGWTTPLWDNEAGTFLNQIYQRADAFPFARRTYEIFAGSCRARTIRAIDPIATALNSRPKYDSTHLQEEVVRHGSPPLGRSPATQRTHLVHF